VFTELPQSLKGELTNQITDSDLYQWGPKAVNDTRGPEIFVIYKRNCYI